MALAELLIGVIVAVLLILAVVRSVRVVPQARARNVERLGTLPQDAAAGNELHHPVRGPGQAAHRSA